MSIKTPVISLPQPKTDAQILQFRNELREMIEDAVKVEIATIPLYLFSMYSIRQDNGGPGTQARAHISVVVHQEMLHLALVGNLLTAVDPRHATVGNTVDSGPKLYSKDFIPTYGGKEDKILKSGIPLKLERCEKSNLESFLKIEAPYIAPLEISPKDQGVDVAGTDSTFDTMAHNILEYNSIGEFYKALEQKLKMCNEHITSGHPFFRNKNKQFCGIDFFDKMMVQIDNQEDALKALDLVRDQGEGSVGIEDAHYQTFNELYHKRSLWTCWPVVDSPKTSKYEKHPFIHNLSLAFDAAYCYLLITITKTWQGDEVSLRRRLIHNTHAIMIDVVNPLALVIVQQPLDTGVSDHAAPAFEYYPTTTGEAIVQLEEDISKRKEFIAELKKQTGAEVPHDLMEEYKKLAEAKDEYSKKYLENIDFMAEELFQAIRTHLTVAKIDSQSGKMKGALESILFSVDKMQWPVLAQHQC